MSKYVDGTVRLQSERRDEWLRELREKGLSGTVDGWSCVG